MHVAVVKRVHGLLGVVPEYLRIRGRKSCQLIAASLFTILVKQGEKME